MKTQANYILATAGHVDHGKTALVKTLTGTDTDRLPEEKQRGLSIELGFAHLELPDPADSEKVFQIGIIDVPGHEDFVKNMVAGIGSIDAALLIIAADEGWMPQTEEHVEIIAYLGVSRVLIALTKVDLLETVSCADRKDIRRRLRTTPFPDALIVETSTSTGQGITALKTALANLLSTTLPAADLGKPRLPIDRAFTLPGIGTVVTGTLTGGCLREGLEIVIQPSGRPARIRGLQTHHHTCELALPGTRVACNLRGIPLYSKRASNGIKRGDTLTTEHLGSPFRAVDVSLYRSAPNYRARPQGAPALRDGMRVRMHHGSSNTPGRVRLIEGGQLEPGVPSYARIRCERPIFALEGDRFIIRDWPERHTLAGGTVLDSKPKRTGFRTPDRRALLKRRAACLSNPEGWIQILLDTEKVLPRDQLGQSCVISQSAITRAAAQLERTGLLLAMGGYLVEARWWASLRTRAAEFVDSEHKAHPERTGITLSRLRRELKAVPHLPDLLPSLLEALAQSGFTKQGIFLGRTDHHISLAEELQPVAKRLLELLTAHPLDPPSRKELTPNSASSLALQFLIESDQAIEISEKVVMTAPAFEHARKLVCRHLQTNGPSTVSQIRNVLRNSRRVAVPLLELFDRKGITLRQGDYRVLR